MFIVIFGHMISIYASHHHVLWTLFMFINGNVTNYLLIQNDKPCIALQFGIQFDYIYLYSHLNEHRNINVLRNKTEVVQYVQKEVL